MKEKKDVLPTKKIGRIRLTWRRIKSEVVWHLPKKAAHQIIYKRFHNGMKINLKDPSTYDEIIHFHSINTYDDHFAKYADKLMVRDFVKECGLEECLVPLYKVYDRVKDIDWNDLPEQFVLMLNHASGGDFYTICSDKSKLDIEKEKRKLSEGMKINFAKKLLEYQYSSITPKILCEKYLENEGQERLNDYKVVCSYGHPIAILVCSDRNEGRDYFSPEWEYLDYARMEKRSPIPPEKPAELQKMLDMASILSKTFPVARIDFYIVNHIVFFSEITLTPSAGINEAVSLNENGSREIGAEIKRICKENGH